MNGLRQNAIRLFRFQGIEVSLHWWWFLIAAYEIAGRQRAYSSILWNALEYLGLFVIVLMHEFGHALACRQVGGIANQIVLWPLGGVAYVNPPQRPGAMLWSIAAGPLVNVALAPILLILGRSMSAAGMAQTMPDVFLLVRSIAYINLGLLMFNMLPVYPLDGGQILRSLLWFVLGRARSLFAATIIGFLGVAGLGLLAIRSQSIWLGIVAAYILTYCLRGWKHASPAALFEIAAQRSVLLSVLPGVSAARRILALFELPESIRHVSIASPLPALLHAIPNHRVPRLRTVLPHQPMDGFAHRAPARLVNVIRVKCKGGSSEARGKRAFTWRADRRARPKL